MLCFFVTQLLEEALENQKRVMLLTETEKQLKVQVSKSVERLNVLFLRSDGNCLFSIFL